MLEELLSVELCQSTQAKGLDFFFSKKVLAVTYVLVQAAVLVLDKTQTSFKSFFQKRKIVLSVP